MKKYNIDFSNLKGEELLTLDEVLSDIIVFNEELSFSAVEQFL